MGQTRLRLARRGNARNAVVTRAAISVGVGEFVFASTYPARGGGCENKSPYYYGGRGVRPLAVLGRPSFSIADHKKLDYAGTAPRSSGRRRRRSRGWSTEQIDCKNPFC